MQQPIDSDSDMDTLGYAVSFWVAAEALVDKTDWRVHRPVAAMWALIAFAIENAFKAALKNKKHDPAGRWSRSHDLTELRLLTASYGMHLSGKSAGVVDALSPIHKKHMFRYPVEPTESDRIPSVRKSLEAGQEIAETVHRMLGGLDRVLDYVDRRSGKAVADGD